MPHNTNTSLKTTAQILYLFWGFLLLIQGQSYAQVNDRDVPLRIYLPAQENFCPNAPFEIAPDSITGGTAPFQYRWILNNEIVSVDSVVQFLISLTNVYDPSSDSDLLNIRDEILAEFNKLKYLLTLN